MAGKRTAGILRPTTLAMALEPRILFDGAAAVAVDQQHHAGADAAAVTRPAAVAEPRDVPASAPAPRNLVVIDARLENRDALLAQLPADSKAIIVNIGDDALAAISQALTAMGKVDSIQIFSHGSSGQFDLGNRVFTSDVVRQSADTLAGWRAELNSGADIQLYGCNIGAGEAGRTLVQLLAKETGADVGASSDDTGNAAAGGNWTLEVRSGDVDKALALSDRALASFNGLLADASPTVGFTSGGTDTLIGDQLTFTLNFTNPSTQEGYAPYIDLFLPRTGKDGDDGVSFVAASYLGQNIQSYVLTFDASGKATHPLAKDNLGQPVVLNAADYGMRAGDQLVVLQVPFSSIGKDQPTVGIQVTAVLSNLADTAYDNSGAGGPDLVIKARAGFQYGNDSANNPTVDPSRVEQTLHSFTVHPTLVTLTQSVDMPEGETPTGPNYRHSETVTVKPANGQTLSNVTVTQTVPDQIQVTKIDPGSGGTLTSVTLSNGVKLTDKVLIDAAIASDTVFISSYTVSYASLSAPGNIVVQFYVPESDNGGSAVLDANTGSSRTITFGTPQAAGKWQPLDPRDRLASGDPVDFTGSGTGSNASFVAKSITLHKVAAIQVDTGSAGLTPGDTLSYSLQLAISDYFAFGGNILNQGEFKVVDTLADGQTLSGTPTFSYVVDGVTKTVNLIYTSSTDANGVTTLTFDIKASIRQAQQAGDLVGDLAFDDVLQGATGALIAYTAVIAQSYTGNYTQKEINEGDAVGNNASVSATVLLDRLNLSGSTQTDGSSTTVTIPTSTIDIDIDKVNGGTPPANGELRPGDVVTFDLNYDLVTGDYEHLTLTAYLPLPLFDVSTINWSNGSGAGQWELVGGPGGNTNLGPFTVRSGPGNSVIFDFGDYAVNAAQGSRIALKFTLRVGDAPFADQRSLAVLAQSNQQTTINHAPLISSDAVTIQSIAEPSLDVRHGVVSSSNGTITGTTGSWGAPGSGGAPFTGRITDLTAVNGDITGIDAGDRLRLATAIENSGGGNAFDVTVRIDIPAGLSFDGGSLAAANLKIYRGDGTQLQLGVDYSVSGNVITFLDAGGQGSLLAGRAGTAADTDGSNIVVISYDVRADAAIAAAATLESAGAVTNYASVNNGKDFAPVDVIDKAGEQVASPSVRVVFGGGSLDNGDSTAGHTTGSNLVIGEGMDYDIVVTLPEGGIQNLRVEDLIPPGMRLDTGYNGVGYALITTAAGSAALSADFNGNVTVGSMTGVSGTLGQDGVDARWTFSAATTSADNVAGNNSFVIRIRLIANNVSGNQAGVTHGNDVRVVFSDPDGDTAGGTATDRTIAASGSKPTITIVEPTLQVSQSTLVTAPAIGVDAGDKVEYVLTISNGTAGSDYDAFDIRLNDVLPPELMNYQLISVSYANGATNNGSVDFEIVNGVLRTVNGANIDIVKGGSITLHFSGIVTSAAASETAFGNTASVSWSSLNGSNNTVADPAGERTGADGTLNSGALNDYTVNSTYTQRIAQALLVSRVGGLGDTAAPSPTNADSENVAVGEIIRYRVVSLVPEGRTDDYSIRVTLDKGLSLVEGDSTVLLAFIANQLGISSDQLNLTTSGTLNLTGNQTHGAAAMIDPQLAGAKPAAVLNGAYIEVTVDGQGRQVITFHLGTLINRDQDADFEGLSLEFNVRVNNVADSSAIAAPLAVQFQDFSGSTSLSPVDTLYEKVVEPNFGPLDKTVTAFDPKPGTSTGNATVTLSFTQTGNADAYDVVLTDSYPQGSNATGVRVEINGVQYDINGTAIPPEYGFSATVGGNGVSVHFDKLAAGTSVKFVYQIDLPNTTTIASTDARLAWSSLPESFTQWGGSSVGADGSASGERNDSGGVNNYVRVDGAGLGIVSGTLWNDTQSATGSAVPDGPGLAGVTVKLTWAGADGDISTSADNLVFTTTTDASGNYRFGVLPQGTYQIDVDTSTALSTGNFGDLRVRIDNDTSTPLGQIRILLGDAASSQANVGYVEQNDAPVNHLTTTTASGNEDTPIAITGLSVSDVDVDSGVAANSRDMQITLTVVNGTLSLAGTVNGLSINGAGTKTLVLTGHTDVLNAALALLRYQGDLNFNGSDTLTIVTDDLGNFGDANGNGTPGEAADRLTDTDTLAITVIAVNDAPVANNDSAQAVEAGGHDNLKAGVNPSGSLLANDTDVDIATNQDVLRVSSVGTGGAAQTAVADGGSQTIQGLYGKLIVQSDGRYTYVVDNSLPAVQALLPSSPPLTETFDYTIADKAGATSGATLTVSIQGANDAPLAGDDVGEAIEKGGTNNGSGGQDASGNVFVNDTDPDAGDGRSIFALTNMQPDEVTAVADLTLIGNGTSVVVVGKYGTMTLNANGMYTYVIDNANADVQKLNTGDVLVEHFTYLLRDTGGLLNYARLDITVKGANDAPVATDDSNDAQVAATNMPGQELNASGNVINQPSHPDTGSGTGVDSDIDNTRAQLTVSGIRVGAEGDAGSLTAVTAGTTSANGTEIVTAYGSLRIGADGSYVFDVDSSNTELQNLNAGQTKTVVYTYAVRDPGGQTDLAQIVITIHGVNDPPVAQNIGAIAIEAGGEANGTLGINPGGDATASSFDPDGDPITVYGVRTGKEADGLPVTDGSGVGGTGVVGLYGTLTVDANGNYSYVVDNSNPTVQALRGLSNDLVEYFTYTIGDGKGGFDSATIVILVAGKNDNPVGVADTAEAREAGGVGNNAPGVDPTGNVLGNDTDVDSIARGETKAVLDVRTGSDAAGGTVGTLGTELRGQFGWLTLKADGSYSYRVDNSMPAVQALLASSTPLVDTFGYTVIDTDGAHGPGSFTTLTIRISGANDAPVAQNDDARAVEAGGVNNNIAGVDPTGNVLANDSDVDTAANGETMIVSGVAFGSRNGTVGVGLAGDYGTLTLGADGNYRYVVDNDNARVQALRLAGQTLTEVFTYTIRDAAGATSTATLTVVIEGRNDNPVALDIGMPTIEAGGTFNNAIGVDAIGNVMSNDSDVDAGDSRVVTNARSLNLSGNLGASVGSTGPVSVAGQYGTLTISADGSYHYALNNDLAAVQALKPGDQLNEIFEYQIVDAAGAPATARLLIPIHGAWDAPVAGNDTGLGITDNGKSVAVNPKGNVLGNDTDVDANDIKLVSGIRVGAEADGGTLDSVDAGVATQIQGLYGTLFINADGSYEYKIDTGNATLLALKPLQTVRDVFTYQVKDGGSLRDLAQLTLTIIGRNDAPNAENDAAQAIEASGVANGQAGVNPSGNVLGNDTDLEGDTLTVVGIRTGDAGGSGTAGSIGTALQGRYGTLTIAADGSWHYEVDNTLPEVEALRVSGQTLEDVFTYTINDVWGADDSAELRITIDGRNDTPVARDDHATAVEAGGVANGNAGVDPGGNVLDNDSDVDSVANGETKQVVRFSNDAGASSDAGTGLNGRYGRLTLNADGAYTYAVDNTNAAVQALRASDQPLSDVFVYEMRDAAGATVTARLIVSIQGANDAPVARDDSSIADGDKPTPQGSGNVLPNDSDVDANDALTVVKVRTGTETGQGADGVVGQGLKGRYGTLVLNADGSYRYDIDMSNPEVLAAAGFGPLLHDDFTYTISDQLGATDQATLVIRLVIPAPYVPPPDVNPTGPDGDQYYRPIDELGDRNGQLPDVDPGVFITQVVRDENLEHRIDARPLNATSINWQVSPEVRSASIGARLGQVNGQFVTQAVRASQQFSDLDLAWMTFRHGRTSLSADGLLSDPSIYAPLREHLADAPVPQEAPAAAKTTASGFKAQLRQAAQKLHVDQPPKNAGAHKG
ncbi:hypothetical protein GCM10007350_06940 [Jeongeupia chitinilytica]|uniref:DUF4347 domain-containing protein n=2 Tax=Jeongeupia chitinilytica TaxID=1041641 RepID=A0ABQ3GXY1_9NEIS|nr:hypothetical protein GCM10007350_06940 [Jeongeupia chitinilytica]